MDRNLYDTKITQTFTYLFDDINMKTWLNHIEMNDLYVLPKRKCMNKQSMLKFLLNQRKLQSFTFFSVFLFIYLFIYLLFFFFHLSVVFLERSIIPRPIVVARGKMICSINRQKNIQIHSQKTMKKSVLHH